MKTLIRNTMFFAAAMLMLVGTSQAQTQRAVGLRPTPQAQPRLGFRYDLVARQGLQVRWVTPGSLAAQMGLERGDMIISVNGQSVGYMGAYDQAMLSAARFGGNVKLAIRDVRTGMIQYRSTNLFGPRPQPVVKPVFIGSGPYYVPHAGFGR